MSQQINLLNPLFLKQKKYFSVVAMAQAAALLSLGLAAVLGYVSWQERRLAIQAAESQVRYVAQKERFIRLSAELSPDTAERQMNDKVTSAEKDLAAKKALFDKLSAGGGEATGFSALLRAFARQAVNGLWLTGVRADANGQQLTIRGRALQAELLPVYIQRLAGEPALKGRAFEKLEFEQRRLDGPARAGFVEFVLTSSIGTTLAAPTAPDAPAAPPAQPAAQTGQAGAPPEQALVAANRAIRGDTGTALHDAVIAKLEAP